MSQMNTFLQNKSKMEDIAEVTEKNSSQGESLGESGFTNPAVKVEDKEEKDEGILDFDDS